MYQYFPMIGLDYKDLKLGGVQLYFFYAVFLVV